MSAFATPVGRSAAALIASADATTELARVFRHQVVLRSREAVVAILHDGVKRGEVRAGLDLEAAADLIMAPVFFWWVTSRSVATFRRPYPISPSTVSAWGGDHIRVDCG